jgi:hypothetical protein
MLSAGELAEVMKAVLDRGSLFRFRARGASMTPFIRDGDTLTLEALEDRAPRVGEVVAFFVRTGERSSLVVHRVVGNRGSETVIQGDAYGCASETIPRGDILGRVVRVERRGGRRRLGLGPERRLIVWFVRSGLLWGLVWPIWNGLRSLIRRRDPQKPFITFSG